MGHSRGKKEDDASLEIMKNIVDEVEFSKDKNNEEVIYALYRFEKHYEFCEISSARFKAFLNQRFRDEVGDEYAYANFSKILYVKKDETILYGDSVQPYTRIAGNKKHIVYFLADRAWNSVIVTKSGWEIRQQLKYMFLKKANTKEQVKPVRCSENIDDLLRAFINMDDDNYILFKVNLIQYFFDSSSHFISIISSEHGTGKSTLTKIMREIVDPAVAMQACIPDSPEEIKNHLANNKFVAFDNTKQQKEAVSDILCGATTGTSLTKRTLYTTFEETILKIKNIIILNGIDIVPNKSDLLERSVLFELKKISPSDRKSESEFWKLFYEKKPYILGAIFDILSKAIAIRQTLELEKTHRMSDAYTDMVAIALAMDIKQDEFIRIFNDNISKLEQTRSEENFFCNIVADYLEGRLAKRTGKISEIYSAIKPLNGNDAKYFPKSSSHFSRVLNKERHSLERLGYSFKTEKKKDGSYIEFFCIKQ